MDATSKYHGIMGASLCENIMNVQRMSMVV